MIAFFGGAKRRLFELAAIGLMAVLFVLVGWPSIAGAETTYTFSGTLRDSHGGVQADQLVTLAGSGESAFTDSNGDFSLTVPAGVYDLRIGSSFFFENNLEGFGNLRVHLNLPDVDLTSGDIQQDLTLEVASVSASLEDSEGNPLAAGDVILTADGGTTTLVPGWADATILKSRSNADIDAQGEATIYTLKGSTFSGEPKSSENICVKLPAQLLCVDEPVTVESDVSFEFVADSTNVFSGTLKDDEGNPFDSFGFSRQSYIGLEPVDSSGVAISRTTDNDGWVSFEAVEGEYRAEIGVSGFFLSSGDLIFDIIQTSEPYIDLAAGDVQKDFVVPLSTLTVTVLDYDGNPISDVTVRGRSNDGVPVSITNDSANFVLDSMHALGDTDAFGQAELSVVDGAQFNTDGPGTTTLCVEAEETFCLQEHLIIDVDTSLVIEQPPPVPDTPVNVSASTPTSQLPAITWDDVATAEEYIIYRDGNQIGTSTQANFTDDQVSASGSYSYSVAAVNVYDVASPNSEPFSVNYDIDNPSISYTSNPAPNSEGWNSSNVTVTFSCDDAHTDVTCSDPVTAASETDGQDVEGTATDEAGNTASVTATVKLDKTQPTIGYELSSAPNANGWYEGEVTVTFTCGDALSGVESCEDPITLSSGGANQTVTGTATDLAGNSTEVTTEPINIDSEAPTIDYELSEEPNANGWINSDVTVTFTCSDASSGVETCSAPVTLDSDGAEQTVTGTATDNAGNTAEVTATLNIDKTDPAISYSLDPEPNANGWINNEATVSFDCEDSLSGVDTCSESVVAFEEIENQEFVGTVTDNAGNTASVTATVSIDKTEPTISYTLDPAPNAAGWNTSDVTVTFTCQDGGSGIESCTDPITVSTEGEGQSVSGTAVDNAGNEATVGLALDVDKTDPTITYALDPAANTNGWNNSDVTVTFDCQDNLGINDCTEPTTITTEGDNHQVLGVAVDAAGQTADVTATVKVDKTNPTVGTPSMSGLLLGILVGSSTNISAPVGDNLGGVVYAEYYFDNDPGQGNGTSMDLSSNPTTDGTATALHAFDGLELLGQHTLYVRTLDAAGNWSTEASLSFARLL